MKQRDAAKLNEEYQRLVRGLAETGVRVPAADVGMAGPGAFIGGGWGVGMLWVLWFLAMVMRWCGVVYCVVSFTVHRSHTYNTHTLDTKTKNKRSAPGARLPAAGGGPREHSTGRALHLLHEEGGYRGSVVVFRWARRTPAPDPLLPTD